MPVHRVPAIPGKFKQEKKNPEPGGVAERVQQMKDRRAATQKIGLKSRG